MGEDRADSDSSRVTLAHELCAALTAMVFLGAMEHGVTSSDTWFTGHLEDVGPTLDFIVTRTAELAGFSEALNAQVRSWLPNGRSFDPADASALESYLSLYAGFLEEPPLDLSNQALIRRLTRYGAELRRTDLLDVLVRAACERPPADDVESARAIVEILGASSSLASRIGDRDLVNIYREWRIARLPDRLNPGGRVWPAVRRRLREVVGALDERLTT